MACLMPVTAVFPFFAGRVVLPLWLPFVTFDFFCPGLVSLFRLFPPSPQRYHRLRFCPCHLIRPSFPFTFH
jgi:hypothetical protein